MPNISFFVTKEQAFVPDSELPLHKLFLRKPTAQRSVIQQSNAGRRSTVTSRKEGLSYLVPNASCLMLFALSRLFPLPSFLSNLPVLVRPTSSHSATEYSKPSSSCLELSRLPKANRFKSLRVRFDLEEILCVVFSLCGFI